MSFFGVTTHIVPDSWTIHYETSSLGFPFVKLRFAQEKSRKSLIQRWATQLEVLRTDSYRRLRAVLTRSALIVDEERGEPLTP